MPGIIKHATQNTEDEREARIRAYWLLFLRCPSNPAPDVDGFYNLGEVGTAPEKTFERFCPYSLAEPKKEDRL